MEPVEPTPITSTTSATKLEAANMATAPPRVSETEYRKIVSKPIVKVHCDLQAPAPCG